MNRRFYPAVLATAAVLSSCHYDPYPSPRAGQPSATVLESQLNERDSLQEAANDLIGVATAMRDAVQRVYPAAQWSIAPALPGGQSGCEPPFTFLSGSIYQLPEWLATAPVSAGDRDAVIAAAADVLRAHHAEHVVVTNGQSVSAELPAEHGGIRLIISPPAGSNPALMSVKGATGCHHAAPGPGPWDIPPAPTSPR
ncbi:LppA family lipoprotein [Mycobacterium sp. 050128]|uniref:LppA family lipoprotein n=1 Tax=Mycobacterium sp. 050128 TaxID=3096112 RepID=UPI002EDA12DB